MNKCITTNCVICALSTFYLASITLTINICKNQTKSLQLLIIRVVIALPLGISV